MIVYARNDKSADPPARPSRPSVTFTAFVALHTMTAPHTTQTGHGSSHPGLSARTIEKVSLTFVAAASHHKKRTVRPKVT
jgi:hypothetical protein